MNSADYVKETTTSIAGTLGDGAVTLTASTGYPRFSTVFGTSARRVWYVIEDTANKKFEYGDGSVASNVLTRTQPKVTWDGTTYTKSNTASSIQFGSSPTSGNIEIRMGPLTETLLPTIPGRQSGATGSDTSWNDYVLSDWIIDRNGGGGVAMTAGRQYFNAYYIKHSGLLTGAQIKVTAAVAASHIAWGLYEITSAGLPGNLLVTFNVVDSSTTGIKTDTTTGTWSPVGSLWMPAGWYGVSVLSDSTPSIQCAPGVNGQGQTPFGRDSSTYGNTAGAYVTQAYASGLISPFSGTPTLISNPGGNTLAQIWFGLKVSA